MYRRFAVLSALAILLAACGAPQPQQSPTAPVTYPLPTAKPAGVNESPTQAAPANSNPLYPVPGEDKMTRGQATVDSASIFKQGSSPVQISLYVKGSLPTPCHILRANAAPADAQKQIQVEIYSLVDPGKTCAQTLQPFESTIPLGSYPDGKYTILINGKQAGEFSVP